MGATVLELILALPVLLIFLAALVEFGLILSGLKYVAVASRAGAKWAAESPALDAASVQAEVDRVLASNGVQSCRVIVEHNVPTGGPSPLVVGNCDCSADATPALPGAAGPVAAVRVTVCVELSELTPNLLAAFGFTTADRRVQQSTTFPYEPL